MSETANGYVPAFPATVAAGAWSSGSGGGLTKREYFAAMAMQGFMANTHFSESSEKSLADCAIKQADVLLAALEATK